MANTDFNPDSYLASAPATPAAPAEFNPDAYLSKDKTGGILPNFAAGFGEGVTGGLAMLDQTLNPYHSVKDLITRATGGRPDPVPQQTASEQAFLNRLLGHIGMNPDDVAAQTLPERLARYAGQGATAILTPGAGEAGLAATTARTLTGAAAGMAGGAAAEAAPDPIKPVVGLFASLAAGIPFSMGLSAAAKIPAAVDRATTLARAGVSNDVAEQTAGKVLAANATDVKSVKEMLARGVPNSPMAGPSQMQTIPGSEPTTFQATGDMGLGALERATATKNPELFRAREAEQNAARITALGGVQTGANPTAVADYFRTQLHDLDTQTASNIANRLDLARQTTAAVGGEVPPEALGQTMRDAMAGAEADARTTERGLWKAVDPDGNLTGNVKMTSGKADDIVDAMRKTEKPMEGEEAAVFKQASALPDVAPVADLIALRSRVSTAMRDELMSSGRTPSYARLVQLRGAIQDNLAKTISDHAVEEAPKVAAGEIAPDASITARVAQWRQNLEAERDRFLQQKQAGTGGQTGAGGPADLGATPAPGTGGAGLPPGGGSAGAPGAPGLPGNAPTFDAAAASRLATATAATKQRAETFGNGPVGQVLRQAGGANLYRLADAGVPGKIFHSGPTAFQDAQALAKAVGSDRATALLSDAAAASLRRAAMTEDGILDPRRVMLWQNKYQDALRALPPNVRDQFMNARNAGQAVAEATAARTDAMKAMQAGKVGQLLGVTTPQEVTNVIGQTFSSPQSATLMKGLADAVRRDPDAAAGLRQAVADHIAKRFISNTEVATSGLSGIKADAFQTFVKQNEPALRQVFTPSEMDTMKAIADDIRQSKRSQNAVRLVGGSNTAQDTAAIGKQSTLLGKLWKDAVGAGAGFHFGGPIGAIVGMIGAHSLQALREAGIANVDQLVTKAMLDPMLARRLLEKAPAAMTPVQDAAFARAIRRSAVPALAVSSNAANGSTR